jgi:hypothetical protein
VGFALLAAVVGLCLGVLRGRHLPCCQRWLWCSRLSSLALPLRRLLCSRCLLRWRWIAAAVVTPLPLSR